jgi:intergrase/recombinase
MYFDLTNDAQRRQFREYAERLLRRGSVVRLTDERPGTPEQQSFYRLLIAFFASRTGIDARIVKALVKTVVCHDIFVTEDGRIRSSSELTRDDMQAVISRFQYWASTVAGVDLPDADKHRSVISALRLAEEHRDYVPQPRMKWLPK